MNRIKNSRHSRMRRLPALLAAILTLSLLVSCGASDPMASDQDMSIGGNNYSPSIGDKYDGNVQTEVSNEMVEAPAEEGDAEMEDIVVPVDPVVFKENDFIKTSDEPISTFSSDVDTASYSYFRKLVNNGYSFDRIRKSFGTELRTEEMLNYFSYRYTAPNAGDLFGVHTEIAPCPWNEESALLMLNMTAETTEPNPNGNNLVFLIDVSGSMRSDDKLPLLKEAFSCLVEQLTEKDFISIVTYSGKEEVVLEGCAGNEKRKILRAIDELTASGSTNGQAGLQKAYELAESCMITGGNNCIIMASDGDLNVGISSAEELKNYIAEKRDKGIYLSVLGFGTGNYKDANMEALADNGNGVYYYIDGIGEAERIFGEGLLSTLYTVAEDVKLQITFAPEFVESYRLIGYENRILATEDFEDDTKDAGEIGSGHMLTVCYELKLTKNDVNDSDVFTATDGSNHAYFTLAVRWKEPGTTESILREYTYGGASYTETPSDDFRFASSVIETAMLLHDSAYIGDVTLDDVISTLSSMSFTDERKNEFVSLLRAARTAE